MNQRPLSGRIKPAPYARIWVCSDLGSFREFQGILCCRSRIPREQSSWRQRGVEGARPKATGHAASLVLFSCERQFHGMSIVDANSGPACTDRRDDLSE